MLLGGIGFLESVKFFCLGVRARVGEEFLCVGISLTKVMGNFGVWGEGK